MKVLVDANIFLAVILNEPEKDKIIDLTRDMELLAPVVLPFEIGNALSAMLKRNRLQESQILDCYEFFKQIPFRLVDVNIEKALEISSQNTIYAYDSYYLEVAKRMNLCLMTLDRKMENIAQQMNISILGV